MHTVDEYKQLWHFIGILDLERRPIRLIDSNHRFCDEYDLRHGAVRYRGYHTLSVDGGGGVELDP